MFLKAIQSGGWGFLAGLLFLATGCDPSINVYGSLFPAWIWCLALGTALTMASRFAFAALRLERHLGPLMLIYPGLTLLLSCLAWLVLFGR